MDKAIRVLIQFHDDDYQELVGDDAEKYMVVTHKAVAAATTIGSLKKEDFDFNWSTGSLRTELTQEK